MPITYVYLDPDSDFTAESLNLRFEAAIGVDVGINSVTVEDLTLGGLRHNHLPRLILADGVSDTTTFADYSPFGSGSRSVFSTMQHRSFSTVQGIGLGAGTAYPAIVTDIDYAAMEIPFTVGMDTDSHVGAVVVLANVDVQRIEAEAKNQGDRWDVNEDVHYGVFYIRIVDSNKNHHTLDRTLRTLSPRVTISTLISDPAVVGGGDTLHFPGFYINDDGSNDRLTNQDVSIRTVISPADLTAGGLSDLAHIELWARPADGSEDWTATLYLGKANITAIPLHTKLNHL